jgi:hypothetical protein
MLWFYYITKQKFTTSCDFVISFAFSLFYVLLNIFLYILYHEKVIFYNSFTLSIEEARRSLTHNTRLTGEFFYFFYRLLFGM